MESTPILAYGPWPCAGWTQAAYYHVAEGRLTVGTTQVRAGRGHCVIEQHTCLEARTQVEEACSGTGAREVRRRGARLDQDHNLQRGSGHAAEHHLRQPRVSPGLRRTPQRLQPLSRVRCRAPAHNIPRPLPRCCATRARPHQGRAVRCGRAGVRICAQVYRTRSQESHVQVRRCASVLQQAWRGQEPFLHLSRGTHWLRSRGRRPRRQVPHGRVQRAPRQQATHPCQRAQERRRGLQGCQCSQQHDHRHSRHPPLHEQGSLSR